MRWKLANGNTVATTKQPVQWKDFDRVEITDDYQDYLDSNGSFEDGGRPAHGDIEFTVRLYNPSTHMIRKSHHYNNCFQLRFITQIRGSDGGRYNINKRDGRLQDEARLINLDYGDVYEWYVYPNIYHLNSHWTHLVNPFEENWGHSAGDPIDNYWSDTFNYNYAVHLVAPRRGGRGAETAGSQITDCKVVNKTNHWIEYVVRH